MKTKTAVFSILVCLLISGAGCGDQEEKKGKVLAQINDYDLMLEDFKQQLVTELEFEEDYKVTREGKKAFLKELIRKELLIQEAKARRLDQTEAFIRAMERYWESTLIRDLMAAKGKEIKKNTYVTEEEIQARYQLMKKSNEDIPPLDKIKEKIAHRLQEEKKRDKLAQWINDLIKNADIQIDYELLYAN